jgi:biopolymer transport protein ExbB
MGLHAGRPAPRRFAGMFACLCFAVVLGYFFCTPRIAFGQEDGGKPAAEQPEAAKDTGPAAPPNLFRHIVRSAGPFFGILLFLLSMSLVAIIVLLAMDLRMPAAVPPAFVDEFTDTVNKRRFREAFDLARGDNSYLGKVLTAGMARLQYGIEDARETAFHTVESIKASKEQLITYLATIGSLGPMLGLVGTVYGMILSFMELSQPGKTPNPQKLADGISHALVITLLGIALAVPAIFCHAFFRNRLIRISMDTATVADDLLTQMFHNSKRAGSGAADLGAATPRGKSADLVKPAEA